MNTKPKKITPCLTKLLNKFNPPPLPKELTFTPEAYMKMLLYTHMAAPDEVTGLAIIENNKIIETYILQQTITGATADADEMAIVQFLAQHPLQPDQSILDWHSHVDIAVSPSGTDWKNYELMLEARNYSPFPYLIINKQESIKGGVYLGDKEILPLTIHQPPTNKLTADLIKSLYEQCKEDIETMCEVHTPIKKSWGTSKNKWSQTNKVYYTPKKELNYCQAYGCGVELTEQEEMNNIDPRSGLAYCDDCII